ncbi:hypothetical protein KA005_61875 [bacterium]|nr:hypothetical protein [bacterium]
MKHTLYEDNKGADLIEIIDNANGTFTFQVGSYSTYILRKTGTISEITNWLAELTFELPNGTKTVEPD